MDDVFLDGLKRDWRSDTADIAHLRKWVARRKARLRAAPWGNLASVLLMGGLFLGFALAAFDRRDPVTALGAFAYLVALVAVSVGFVKSLRNRFVDSQETPLDFLRLHRRLIAAARRSLWGARCAAIILIALCAAVWLMAAAGYARPGLAAFQSATWGAAAILTWAWQIWRRRGLDDEADACDRMIAACEEADREKA
ncbi:hypothetical protein [Sphingomonas colocasiae]|uniref:Uncharacterized protein n=1 Tax=Sphingomonas colocasiae TaxID=1848973 RepID=A0ABS7PXC8_9SPHN|nr:hypothetical protein [Sphingomonas colocasiae]MBY8825300.1 hypothetical protein [Sphingomonas colocasiae]